MGNNNNNNNNNNDDDDDDDDDDDGAPRTRYYPKYPEFVATGEEPQVFCDDNDPSMTNDLCADVN